MSVHGLVYDMTAKAAKEAALGAGANLVYHSAGKLSNEDLEKIKSLNLNMIMIAGGVDFGEKETALYNSEAIARLKLSIPVLYAEVILLTKMQLRKSSRKMIKLNIFILPKMFIQKLMNSMLKKQEQRFKNL